VLRLWVRIFFFLSRIFLPEYNIRLYDKNSETDYFFFLHQNQNIFFSNIGNQNIFLEKNHNPPLQIKWSFPKHMRDMHDLLRFSCSMLHFNPPPLFKLNGRSLMKLHLCTSQVTCTRVNKILGVDTQYTAKVKNLWNKFAQPMISLNWSWIIGGYGFLFCSEFFFRTTQELEYLFFGRAKHKFFFQNLTLGYMTKTLNQIIFFS
jgi:hypothetical protein